MSFTTFRTMAGTSTHAFVVISPHTRIVPVVVAVSHATREFGSWRRHSSSIASEIWSHSLSGWPSVTDSLVNMRCSEALNDFNGLLHASLSLDSSRHVPAFHEFA